MSVPGADFIEWIAVLVMIPVATFAFVFRVATAFYAYLDAAKRTGNRVFAAAIAVAVFFCYWPISFLAYIACTVCIDRRRIELSRDCTQT